MRPTLKEKDLLIVSKTAFAINKPLRTGHLYFNEDLLSHGDIVIFTTADMNVKDSDYMYFYLIPGKKQFIKRLIGKPGDTLYFYGGKIYGIDKNGNEIKEFQTEKWFTDIEHIPFIRFEGDLAFSSDSYSYGTYNNVIINQTNTPIAQLKLSPYGGIGKLLTNKKPPFAKDFSAKNYYDIWGFENYAMGRILTKNEAVKFNYILPDKESDFYLELTHHPSIEKIQMEKDLSGKMIPSLSYTKSLIPLNKKHLDLIFDHLYTCRFKIKNNKLIKTGFGQHKYPDFLYPNLKNVPNGCYEFQDGIAYKINLLGISKKLNKNHPIYDKESKKIVLLYNLGIEMNNLFTPKEKNQRLVPSRYAYFRDGDLFLMGSPIFTKEDPVLINFIESEKAKAEINIPAFIDMHAPILTNGELNREIIFKYGLKVPDNYYFMLGDNHAMSADSRDFGFVPQENLRGKPAFIYWPMQNRFGKIPQPASPLIDFPKVIIFSLGLIIILACYFYYKKKHSLPTKFHF